MPKLFDKPFAVNGDKDFVPNIEQSDGSVSYPEGFGPDYEKDPLDASSKPVPRQGTNQIFFDITDAVGDVQKTGFPTWQPTAGALIGGYPKNATVWWLGDSWQSQVDSNTSTPGPDELTWLSSAQYQGGGGGGGGGFGLNGPTTVAVGGSFTYKIDPYTTFLTYSATASNGTVAISGDTLTLTIAAGETSNVTDVTVLRSDGASVTVRIAIGAQSIAKPAILAPAPGATDVPLGPTLTATAFATYPNGADTHLNTDWRIRNMAGAVVWQSLANATNKTTIIVPDNTLPLNTQLQVDVRYRGTTLPVSAWSDPVIFTTTNQSIVTPTITSPLNGATNIGKSPAFTASAFSTNPLGADTHKSSDWRLKNSAAEIIWSSYANTVNKTAITVPAGIVAVSSQYTMEVRYNGNVLQPSQWSPVVSFTTAAAFDFGKYLAYSSVVAPFIGVYGQDIDTLNKLANPSTLPQGTPYSVDFASNGDYVAVGMDVSPYLAIYKRSGDTFVRLASPPVLPTGAVRTVKFSPDSNYLYATSQSAPFLYIYLRNGDTFTRVDNPNNAPNQYGPTGIDFSSDGQYVNIVSDRLPYQFIYRITGTTLSILAPPIESNQTNACAFGLGSTYIACAQNVSPYFAIFKKTSDTSYSGLPNPAALPGDVASAVDFSADGTYVAVGCDAAVPLVIYKRNGDTFTKLANPAVLPAGRVTSVAFSRDGLYLFCGHSQTPFVTTYKRNGDTFTKLTNPAVLPAGFVSAVACFPTSNGGV